MDLTERLQAAASLVVDKRFSDAIAIYEQLLVVYPQRPKIYVELGRALEAQQRFTEATEIWRTLLHHHPDSPTGRLGLVRCLRHAGTEPEALAELDRYQRDSDTRVAALNSLALIYGDRGQWERATQYLQQAVAHDPASSNLRVRLINALLKQDRSSDALALANEWLTLGNGPPLSAIVAAIDAATRLSALSEARAWLQRALAHPEANSRTAVLSCRYFSWRQQHDDAIDAAKQWAQRFKHDWDSRSTLPQALLGAGYPRQAADCLHGLLEIFPGRIEPLIAFASALQAAQGWDEAYAAWQAVLDLQPDNPKALNGLVASGSMCGHAESSSARLADAVRNAPNSIDVLDAAVAVARSQRRAFSQHHFASRLLAAVPESVHYDLLRLEALADMGRLGEDHVGEVEMLRRRIGPRDLERFISLQQRLPSTDPQPPNNSIGLEVVDVVYTWVDGGDPVWQQKKAATTGLGDPRTSDSPLDNWRRYESHGEIHFSLRTVERYFPQVRRIFIVTDNQQFDIGYLSDSIRQRIQFVDHSEIIPAEIASLPTFNSDVISAFLHRIPGLSETFIYLNDDVFLGSPLQASDVFSGDGRTWAYVNHKKWTADYSRYIDPSKQSEVSTDLSRNAHTVMCFRRTVGEVPDYIGSHLAVVLTQELCERTFSTFRVEWARHLFPHQTRKSNSLRCCSLREWLAVSSGIQKPIPASRLNGSVLFGRDLSWEHVAQIMSIRPKFFCINVTNERRPQFDYLRRYFLESSSPPVPPDPLWSVAQF